MAETTHVVCPACKKINRLATARLGDLARCGACKQSLFPGVPIQLDDATFDRFIGRSDLPVVVDFWASWCGPCKVMAPAYENAAAQLEPQTGTRFGIRSIPTLVMFKQGREVARQSGAMSQPQIEQWVRAHAV